MIVANSLSAYTANFKEGKVKDLKITIEKAENGYIFNLNGGKELPYKQRGDAWNREETFNATFVYAKLGEGLAEVEGFFKSMDEILDKKIAARIKQSESK